MQETSSQENETKKRLLSSLEKSSRASTKVNDAKVSSVEDLTALSPHKVNNAFEYGHENALNPPVGVFSIPSLYDTTGSTTSEEHKTDKTGIRAVKGKNTAIVPLDHVRVDSSEQHLTTNQGVNVSDNQHTLKAGLRGPALLEDFVLREKITHFDHERIPERIVHARGSAAHGYFECYESQAALTRAAPFQKAGKITPTFVRFSTVIGERGSKDTARDVRGFAVKFYTDQGNWDLVGNNMPVFFIQDAMKFPDLVHAAKPEPHNAMPQAASAHDTFWDFVSLMPESTHMLMWLMSDRAIPRSYRTMEGFGVNTFRLVNEAGESQFVKFHWKPLQGTHSLVWDEAVKISGADPDFHRRDLWNAIEGGEYPAWELGFQVFTEKQSKKWSFDILDATKLVPEELVPVKIVGRLVLNRNPDNFFAETEQVAFCTAQVIPGIDFSHDPLLAGRIHSYLDTQLTRLGGPNFHEIPINAPLVQVHNNQRDGLHRQSIHRGAVAYEPNSLAGGCPFQAGKKNGFVSFPTQVSQDTVRGSPEKFSEHYAQATLFYDSQSSVEQDHIVEAFRFELSKVSVPAIRQRMVAGLRNVSEAFASRVAQGLGVSVPDPLPRAYMGSVKPEVTNSPSLSLRAQPGITDVRSLTICFIVTDGVEDLKLLELFDQLHLAGADPCFVGTRIGTFISAGERVVDAKHSLETTPGFLYDALVLPAGTDAIATLATEKYALEAIRDHYYHGKPILAFGESSSLLARAGVVVGAQDTGIILEKVQNDLKQKFALALNERRHSRTK